MSEGQDQRNRDFNKGMTDAQFAYIEAERLVAELKSENEQLRKLASALFDCSRDGLYTDELPCQWCDLKSQEICERMARELGVNE